MGSLKADFDNDGSKRMKMEELDDLIHTAYSPSQEGGLSGYIDRFLTYLHELEMLQEKDFDEDMKKRFLLNNIKGVVGAAHLVQKCRDDLRHEF